MSITVTFEDKDLPETIHRFGQVKRRHVGRVFRDTEGALYLIVEIDQYYAPMSLSGDKPLYVSDVGVCARVSYPLVEEHPQEIKIVPSALRTDDF